MTTDDTLRNRARDLIATGIAAADPAAAVARAMQTVLAGQLPAADWKIVALGKAARAMADAALAALPDARALIITNAGNDALLDRATILVTGHPDPDEAGEAAALQVEALLRGCHTDDRVLALISGGGSAMLPAPVAGMTLADKQQVNRLLLASGADIRQTNLIRQALSRLKGGGWLRLCPAPITALILSDVPGDDLRVVASGPTVAPIGTMADAARTARDLGIWDNIPASAQQALERDGDRGVPPDAVNILVGSNGQSIAAMIDAGATAGGLPLAGDVEDCAQALVAAVRDVPPGAAVAFGGETTVRLTGNGMGGRNQELALRFARAAQAAQLGGQWLFASVGSDGRDGPGHAAGGMVGPETVARIRAAGIDPDDALAQNDSTPALDAAGGLVITGPTGTNVADLAVFLRGDPVSIDAI